MRFLSMHSKKIPLSFILPKKVFLLEARALEMKMKTADI